MHSRERQREIRNSFKLQVNGWICSVDLLSVSRLFSVKLKGSTSQLAREL